MDSYCYFAHVDLKKKTCCVDIKNVGLPSYWSLVKFEAE